MSFEESQNWIGGTRPGNAAYVPPPPEYVLDCMGQLESFLHLQDNSLPLLVRAGLVHAQFETIHPFLDGNGRVGRLLITFMLCAKEVLREPILYLSLFFKKHRRLYYDRLNGTREDEGWTAWMDFFLQGIRDTANQAARTASNIDKLFRTDGQKGGIHSGHVRSLCSALGQTEDRRSLRGARSILTLAIGPAARW